MTLPNVKNIGDAAFRECSKLTTLNLGQSLVDVGNEAFYGCANVTKLTFPNTTQSIGNSAFYNCSSVTEVTVGSGLKSIGASGFYGCKSFTALILPDAFTTMGVSAFEGCTKLTVAKLGTSLTAVPAKAFKNCTSLSEMVIPASTKSIGDQALYNDSGLATITMNEGLETIGNEVFWNNSGVMQFSIPGTVTSMGTNCFYGCTRTTYLTFRDGTEILKIDNSGTRSSVIDAKTTNTTYRDRKFDYFYDCPIRFLTLGRNLTYSYSDGVSMYDLKGTSFNSVSRASAPFVNSTELRSVTIGPKVTSLYHHLFDGCANLATLRMGQSIENIYTYAFRNCDKLVTVDFPETLKLIDVAAFADCDALTGATFPGQLTRLGNSAYSNCPLLKDVVFNESDITPKPSLTIGDYTFAKCSQIRSLSFPGRLRSIGNYTFKQCAYLTDVIFQDSYLTVTLGYGAATSTGADQQDLPLFGNCNLQSLYIGRNISYNATSGYGYSPFYNQQYLTDVRFSQAGTVTSCMNYMLYGVNNCKSLVLPTSLKTIGSRTFASMTMLEGITIPNAVTEIGTYAFSNDAGLKYAHLSTSCPWLKEGLFNSCDSLESITIPPVVTKMDTKMFANCKSLASVTFEGSSDILEMGYGASQTDYGLFRDCPLETLNLDRWLSYNTAVASRSPFYSIATLKNITFGENVGLVDKYMFSYCSGIEEVYLPDNIESVGLWGFRCCSSLKKVRFSEKLSQVSDYGFSGCTSLDNVVFPESMTSIADNSFSYCTSLKKLDLGDKLMIIGPAAFKNDTALEGIEIPETLYGLGVEAFANCRSLPNVSIRSISSVGKQAFQGCSGLQWVSLSDKTTSLGEDSFDGCTGIKYVKSYAEFPPEGLVNFPADVVANGTLFVPEYSVDYYEYSPTWKEWASIRPLNDNVMVSSVELDKTEISFKASESVVLTAVVGAEDATDKNILWKTSDENIATVDASGVVTAIAVGEATVTALAADGSGVKAECKVTVTPTLVESINIAGLATSLKKGRTLELQAEVLPATATNATLRWSVSDSSVATVDQRGVVKAVSAGEVNVKAAATDDSGIATVYTLTVIPPTKGDSNDNDVVTITDAVNTANYAVGNEVENFCFEAADVNGDNKVTLADASGTVTVLLDMPALPAAAKISAVSRTAETEQDKLVVDNYSADAADALALNIALDNTIDYVALQADIVLPEGMSMVSVKAGDRAAGHSLATRQIGANTTRIVLFDLGNNVFGDNDEALAVIEVKVNGNCTDDIRVDNILASDAQAHEYVLTSTGGHNSAVSGLTGEKSRSVEVAVENGEIIVFHAAGNEIAVYAPDGAVLTRVIAADDTERFSVLPGVYIVSAGDCVTKVVVK
ncbi:MAG: leucine-rich repeat protein [Muribaculaceae bacterium]|nr:leucine-rich repeat protein [Muribaculaceae bacterium]